MRSVTFFPVYNRLGTELLNEVAPLCRHLGVRFAVAPPDANRGTTVAAHFRGHLIVWDGSVEEGHPYRAFTEMDKRSRRSAIVSRTPLPRNVLAVNQCAPVHGHEFTNADLAEWLHARLPHLLGEGPPGQFDRPGLASHFWHSDHRRGWFLSYRGSYLKEATDWKSRHESATGEPVRMVPAGEYAYETECVTRQRMWEVVARLGHEMTACGRLAVLPSADYFDSFWTASEALWTVNYRPRNSDGRSINGGYTIQPDGRLGALPTTGTGFHFPCPSAAQKSRLHRLLNNCDPLTAAPETKVPPSGLGVLLAGVLRWVGGYYDPEFTAPAFWDQVLVPCPGCRLKHRGPSGVDWQAHLEVGPPAPTDGYGYFGINRDELTTGIVTCPRCQRPVRLRERRLPRTLWVPAQTTEHDQERPVIVDEPVWEAEPGAPLAAGPSPIS